MTRCVGRPAAARYVNQAARAHARAIRAQQFAAQAHRRGDADSARTWAALARDAVDSFATYRDWADTVGTPIQAGGDL
jgi:hypothetical protein